MIPTGTTPTVAGPPPGRRRPARGTGAWAAVMLAVGLVLGAVVAGPTGAAGAVPAQTATSVPVSACVPGATVPAGSSVNGPSPVGRCEPTRRQRLIDSAVWLWLVALLVGLAAVGVVALVRSVRGRQPAAN